MFFSDVSQTVVNTEDYLNQSQSSSSRPSSQTPSLQTQGQQLTPQHTGGQHPQVGADSGVAEVMYANGNVYQLMQQQVEHQQQIQQQHPPPQPTTPVKQMIQPTLTQQSSQIQQQPNGYQDHHTPVLPAYRSTPDYEAVMRQRMEQITQQQNLEQINNFANLANLSQAQVYSHPETMAYSQPEISHSLNYTHHYINQHGYVNSYVNANGNAHIPYHPVDRTNSLNIHPTYSTPELNSQGLSNFSTSENMITEALLNHYKPPPPYPRPSISTPDLATRPARSALSGSPDLVSRRNLNISNLALIEQSKLDQSVDNLTMETHNLHLSQQMLNMSRGLDDTHSSGHSDYHTNKPRDYLGEASIHTDLSIIHAQQQQQQQQQQRESIHTDLSIIQQRDLAHESIHTDLSIIHARQQQQQQQQIDLANESIHTDLSVIHARQQQQQQQQQQRDLANESIHTDLSIIHARQQQQQQQQQRDLANESIHTDLSIIHARQQQQQQQQGMATADLLLLNQPMEHIYANTPLDSSQQAAMLNQSLPPHALKYPQHSPSPIHPNSTPHSPTHLFNYSAATPEVLHSTLAGYDQAQAQAHLDSETIDSLDTSRIPSDHESSVSHSKTSSLDNTSLSNLHDSYDSRSRHDTSQVSTN